MHKRGWCHHAVSVWLFVRLSVTFVSCVKTNKDIFEIFSPSGSHTILVFPYQTGWQYSDGNSPNEGVECRWGRQKTRLWMNSWLRCIKVYSVINRTSREVSKTKPLAVEHTAASVVLTRRRRSVCDGLDVIRRRRRSNPPDTTTLVNSSVYCCRRTS